MSTKKETIRVHLEIDKTQEEATAYDYPYELETGNVMYCMPMMGTTVSLYFGDWDERTGRIINCVRTNGADSCSEMVQQRILQEQNVRPAYLVQYGLIPKLTQHFQTRVNL